MVASSAMNSHRLPPAILIMGPTASGKTAVAMSLADHFPTELISVDSAQVFCGMNIGTAKPDAATLACYPHRLIDILSPEDSYSAARFREDALIAMKEITTAGKIPVLVGGTMLYFRALLQGLAELPKANPVLRAQIDVDAAQHGWPYMHKKLSSLDPSTATRLHATDSQRIQRALEVCLLAGKPMSTLLLESTQQRPAYDFLSIGLLPDDRTVLHERIAHRFDQMLQGGLDNEVRQLRQKYKLDLNLPSMRCVGYRQTWEAQDGLIPAAELRDRGIFATRQLAKRQITWLSNSFESENYNCLAADLAEKIKGRVAEFIKS